MKKRIAAAVVAAGFTLGYVIPAEATTKLGTWATNEGVCGTVVVKGQYNNHYVGRTPYVSFTGLSVRTTKPTTARLVRYTITTYDAIGLVTYGDTGTISKKVPTGWMPQRSLGIRNVPRKVSVRYRVWLSDRRTCSGMWNIGR